MGTTYRHTYSQQHCQQEATGDGNNLPKCGYLTLQSTVAIHNARKGFYMWGEYNILICHNQVELNYADSISSLFINVLFSVLSGVGVKQVNWILFALISLLFYKGVRHELYISATRRVNHKSLCRQHTPTRVDRVAPNSGGQLQSSVIKINGPGSPT